MVARSKMCLGCKKVFFAKGNDASRPSRFSVRRFCSRRCSMKYGPKRIRKPESFSELEKQRLRDMGKLFGYKKGHMSWNKGKKCPECGRKGNKPWNYTGVTPVILNIRNSYSMRQWRSDVFTRDDFTCQGCLIRGGKLHAHHIKPFSIIVKENNIKSLEDAISCCELWDINNGRTLCIPCHKQTDNYGNKPKKVV
jgi:hypothetical protein